MHGTLDFLEISWFPLILAQIIRGFGIAVAPFCIVLSYRLSRLPAMPNVRKWLFVGLSFMLATSTYTQIDRFNAPVTPRLFINLVGVIASLVGLTKMNRLKGEVQ